VIQREHDGVRWELQPDFAPRLDDLLKSPGETVKESPAKRVTSHQLGGRSFYIKRYFHHAVPLRPLKFFFKPTQARQEWDLAQQLEARDIPIVRHVALGERQTWGGTQESILITEGFDGVQLNEAPGVDPSSVLKFVERMHDKGVMQQDLHPGNILVGRNLSELRLVDLHGTLVKPRLSREERQSNLAMLRVYLPIPVPDEIVQLSRLLRRELLFQRSKRCLWHNREFGSEPHGGLKWHVRLPLVNESVHRVLDGPDGFLQTRATILKPGRTSTVGKADGLVLKRFNFRKLENLVKDLFRPSRARRSFRAAYHLELTGITTARTVATADRRICGLLVRSYLLMEEIHGAVDLTTFFRRGGKADSKLVRAAAQLLAKLHSEGFSHRDLKESNLVMGGDGLLYLIDLDGMTFLQHVPDERASLDLARLARGVGKYPAITPQHRSQFHRTYLRSRGLRRLPRNVQTGD
jgi:tRNA A-37 threonylcarbamoyl transferase component Bud32